MRATTVLLGLTAAAALTVAQPTAASAAPRTVLDHGHVDVFGVAYENGELDLHVHDESTGAELDPCRTVLAVNPAARTGVPADPAYSFLGAAGEPVWILPDHEEPGLLFAGWGAEEIPAGTLAADHIRLDIEVAGAGDLALFTVDDFGRPAVLADSSDGVPDHLDITAGGHGHLNWGFTEPGWYALTVTASGALPDGTPVRSDSRLYWFQVKA